MTRHTTFLEKEPLFEVTYNRDTARVRGFGNAVRHAVILVRSAPRGKVRKPPALRRVG